MEEEDLEIYANTSGHKKLMNYVQALFEDPAFIEYVNKLRKKVGIVEGTEYLTLDKVTPYHRGVDELLLKYKLNYMWADMVGMFVNDYTKTGGSWGTICEVQDVIDMKEDPLMNFNEKLDDNAFPLSLRISPYASQRDLIDYIKRMYEREIKPIQKKYLDEKIKIGKFRSKKDSIKKRNEFIINTSIYQLRKLAL